MFVESWHVPHQWVVGRNSVNHGFGDSEFPNEKKEQWVPFLLMFLSSGEKISHPVDKKVNFEGKGLTFID